MRVLRIVLINLGLTVVILGCCDLLIQFFIIPPWPARDLHGVRPEVGLDYWASASRDASAVQINSWGQRDKERTIKRPEGISRRILFIGDSFLEEVTRMTLNLAVEAEMPQTTEVINLGVSVSGPIDYYWRLRRVGLALDPTDVVLFFYTGNDLEFGDSVQNDSSWFAHPTRDCWLCLLYPGFNFFVGRRYMPAPSAWIDGSVLAYDRYWHQRLVGASEDGFRGRLCGSFQKGQECIDQIGAKDWRGFYRHLAQPDEGRYRHYLLAGAMEAQFADSTLNLGAARDLIARMDDLSKVHGFRLWFVLVPAAFEVDPRFNEVWAPVGDLPVQFRGKSQARADLRSLLIGNKVPYLDLQPVLAGKPNMFLNFDGHWNDRAIEAVKGPLLHLLQQASDGE